MTDRPDQVVYLNNCEVFIESLAFSRRGGYYLVWKKGKKNIQSNIYQSNGNDPIFPKEVLSLSLKVYYQSGMPQPRHTHLILFSAEGQQIERTKLMVDEWGLDYSESIVQLGGGNIKLRVKRKSIMKLQKFHRLRNEVQETSEDESARFLKKISMKRGNSQKDQLIKLSKQVEDLNYLVEKLKQERNSGLSKIQKLETQLSQISSKVCRDINKLKDYYAKKIEVRESIYKEEIQQLVTSFNRSYQNNRQIMIGLINDKYEYEEEIRQLKESNQEFITRQSQNFQNLIGQMERHKEAVDEELKDSNQKLTERENTIIQLNQQIAKLNEELQQARQQFKKLESDKEQSQLRYTSQINDLNLKVNELQGLNTELNMSVQRLNTENRFKDEQITSYNNMITEHVREKNQMHADNMQLIDERQQLATKNQIANMNNEQLMVEVKQLQDELAKMQRQNEDMSRQYNEDLDKMNENFKKEIQAERQINFDLMSKRDQLQHEKQMLTIQIADRNANLQQKDHDIDLYVKELQQNKIFANQLTKQLDDAMLKLREQHRDMSDQLTVYMQKASILETENTQLHASIRQLNLSTQHELMKMKDEYDALMLSNKQLLQDQIDLLQRTKQQEENQAFEMKNQYEKQINSIMDQHRTEMDELQKVFREDIDKKQAEIYKIMQEKLSLQEQFEAYKFRIKMEEDERQIKEYHSKEKDIGKKKVVKEPSIDQIQQIQQIDQQQDEDDYIPLKKKKTITKKKALLFEDIDSQEQEEQQQEQSQPEIEIGDQQQGQEIRQSVIEMMKKKKSSKNQESKPKSKLKMKKNTINIEDNSMAQSLQFSKDIQLHKDQESQQQEPQPKKKIKGKKSISHGVDVNKILQEKADLEDKVLDLECQIQEMKVNEQTLKNRQERQVRRHLNKIKTLEGQIFDLNREVQELIFKIKQSDKDYADKVKRQSDKKKKQFQNQQKKKAKEAEEEEKKIRQEEDSKSQASIRSIILRKESKQDIQEQSPKSKQDMKSQKNIKVLEQAPPSPRSIASRKSRKIGQKEQIVPKSSSSKNYKMQVEGLEDMLVQKQKKIEAIQMANRQLKKQVQKLKIQNAQKNGMIQSKVLQKQKQGLNVPQVTFAGDSFMKQSIANLQEKVTGEKEKYLELKMKHDSKIKQNEELSRQASKLKRMNEELQERMRRQGVPRSNQEMQGQIDDLNRKILQLSRSLNQARLERDSLEDEVRIVRKKLAQLTKSNHDNEARSSEIQRQADDLRRKEQKYKRQIEQYQQDIKRIKQINRKTLEEISQVRKSQSQYIIERKKVLDEVVRLEGVVAQKQTDLLKANKQTQKLRAKMNDNMQGKQGRQREYRTQMERLEIERSKLQRKNRQNEQTIKLLNEKMNDLEKQNKKNNEERKHTYGQKIRGYIDQVNNISKVVEDYQHENLQLKHQNAQFFDQNELLKTSFEKLQIKYEQINDYSSTLQEEVNKCNQKILELETQLKAKLNEEEKNKIVIASLRKQLDNQRVVGRKKTQKAQQLEQINERFLYDIKNLRLRLNEYETNADDKQKLAEQLFASQRTIGSLEEELHKISQEYQHHTVKYVYTLEDVEAAIKELKQHEQKVKEEEMTKIIYEIDQNSSTSRQNMQKQLLTLYNQNQKLRVNLHKANEDALQVQLQLAEMEHLKQKCKILEKDKSMLERRVRELTDELKDSKQDIRRIQIKFNESVRSQQNKATENLILQQKYDEISKRYQQLTESHTQMKQDDRKLLEKYKSVASEKDKNIEKMNNEIQKMHNKLLANELEINRLKQMDVINSQDYFKNKKKLQNKIDEISQNHRQRQRQIEVNFKSQLRDWKNKHQKVEEELNQRVRRIQELEEGVFMLQNEVQQLTAQLTSSRSQLAEESELYTIQVNRLRNEMREMQLTYDNNLRNLEEQLSAMSKQLTTLKYARQNVAASNSRLRVSRQSDTGDDRSMRRFQQKIRLKDRRIEELKETIVAYEEKLTEHVGKKDKSEEVQYWKGKLTEAQSQWKLILQKKSKQNTQLTEAYKKLKETHLKCTTREEQLLLILEEKELELSSIKSQLSTISKLYTDLQKQLDKRKQYLNRQIQEESTLKVEQEKAQKQLTFKQQTISQLQIKINQIQILLKKKTQEIKNYTERINSLEKEKRQWLEQERKKIAGQNDKNIKSQERQSQVESVRNQNRRLRNEINLTIKQNESIKSELNHKDFSIKQLLSQVQSNDKIISQNQALLSKYIDLNQQSLIRMGVNIEQLLPLAEQLRQAANQKEQQLLKLTEQLQEIKFEYDNKFLNYEQLKKENYELTLNIEEKQNYQLRVQELQDQILLIQSQKQDLEFRLNSLYIQLQSFKEGLNRQSDLDVIKMKDKIGQIVSQQYR